MSSDDDFERWFRRMRRRSDIEDVEKTFDDMFREMFDNLPKNLPREERLLDGSIVRRMGPFVYGYSMTMGSDGKPVIREFGNVKPSRKSTPFGNPKTSLEVKEERNPLVDVISDNGTIRVIAEVPGVDKKNIQLNCSERMLTISVDTEKRKYYKEVDLPAEVDPRIGKATYLNGVLEVVLKKMGDGRPQGERIRID